MPDSIVTSKESSEPMTEPQSVSPSQESIEDALHFLENFFFVRASEVMSRVIMATKDSDGVIIWITLEKEFHSTLMKTVFALCSKHGIKLSYTAVKTAVFSFLLSILRGEPQPDFFVRKEVESKANRANRERKRIARKRSRAAARERSREETLLQNSGKSQSRTCATCGKKFSSRKTRSKHVCTGVPKEVRERKETTESKVEAKTSEAKLARRRRARARKALLLKEKKRDAFLASQTTTVKIEVVATKLANTTSVTEESGVVISLGRPGDKCEHCESPAAGYKYGLYPKCRLHTYGHELLERS